MSDNDKRAWIIFDAQQLRELLHIPDDMPMYELKTCYFDYDTIFPSHYKLMVACEYLGDDEGEYPEYRLVIDGKTVQFIPFDLE